MILSLDNINSFSIVIETNLLSKLQTNEFIYEADFKVLLGSAINIAKFSNLETNFRQFFEKLTSRGKKLMPFMNL